MNGEYPMFEITVMKKELIDKIRQNRDEHREVFEQALEGYRELVTEQLEKRIKRLQAGKKIEETLRFVIPEDHTEDYDRVIAMLEMDVSGDTITLEEDLYAMYVDNDWAWAKNFAISNAGYTASVAGSANYRKFVK